MIDKLKTFIFGDNAPQEKTLVKNRIIIIQVDGDINKLGSKSFDDSTDLALIITAKVLISNDELFVQYLYNGFNLIRLGDTIDLNISSISEKYGLSKFIDNMRACKITEQPLQLPFTIIL